MRLSLQQSGAFSPAPNIGGSRNHHSNTQQNRAAVNQENIVRQVVRSGVKQDGIWRTSNGLLSHRSPPLGRGARTSPTKNPATKPHMWAAILTWGVERSKAIWITTISATF